MNPPEPPKQEQWKAWLDEFQSETDRGCTLLAAAFLDEQLRMLLERFFVSDPKQIDRLFTGFGPLSNFSARISVAYALGFLSPGERQDLDQIRKIRNDFAHELQGLAFASRQIEEKCKSLKSCRIVEDEQGPIGARDQFVVSAALLAQIVALRRLGVRDSQRTIHQGMKRAGTTHV